MKNPTDDDAYNALFRSYEAANREVTKLKKRVIELEAQITVITYAIKARKARSDQQTMTVAQIVDQYLKANNLDGLYSEDGECACLLADLAPCGEMGMECRAGMRVACPSSCNEHDWHVEAEYQKQATLIQALEALCATWTQANSGEAGASCFRCGKCGEWYTTISDALECCQAAEGE